MQPSNRPGPKVRNLTRKVIVTLTVGLQNWALKPYGTWKIRLGSEMKLSKFAFDWKVGL